MKPVIATDFLGSVRSASKAVELSVVLRRSALLVTPKKRDA